MDLSFYKEKKVFITGHTGFKGSWMCKVLLNLGAKIIGYSLPPPTSPNLFEIAKMEKNITSIIGDIRNLENLKKAMLEHQPDIAIHMAAQPLVRESYENPVYTYETNVVGTVNFLEAVRFCKSVRSVINVTTDKVYENKEWCWGYRENESLDGFDPYSNSKSCSELITSSYKNSFFLNTPISVSTCRAGNVIGGGDFSKDRIIPDCICAVEENKEIIVRNPYSIRPYQHVLEPVCAYLFLAQNQYENTALQGSYNIGPDECDCVQTGALTDLFCKYWGEGAKWKNVAQVNAPHEANFLKLDCSKIKTTLDWSPKWHISDAVEKTVEWSKSYLHGENSNDVMVKQIHEYVN